MPVFSNIPKLSKITILNVDDDEAGRYAHSRILRKAGFMVEEAANGLDCLRIVKDLRPELVVLDINLPDVNGFDVCRRIKSDPTTSLIPVLHLSASFLDSGAKAEGLESGADAYLTEPVDARVLIATVHALLRAREAEDKLRKWG